MFVDAEFDFVVQRVFDLHLKAFIKGMTLEAYKNFGSNHPTTRLSRLLSINFGCSDWRMAAWETETLIPGKGEAIAAMILIHNEVRFYLLGQSGRYARVRASRRALEVLDGLPPYEFRSKYGCDCVDEGEGESELDLKKEDAVCYWTSASWRPVYLRQACGLHSHVPASFYTEHAHKSILYSTLDVPLLISVCYAYPSLT
jgi:endoribonuclease Dicer